jgi:PAS domain S-box-containing protein
VKNPATDKPSSTLERVSHAQAKVAELKSLLAKIRSAADGQQASLSRLAQSRRGVLPREETDKAIRQMVASLMLFEALGSSLAETFSEFEEPLTALMREVTVKLRERERLAALSRSAQALSSSLDLNTLLDEALSALVELTGAERAFLMLRDDDRPAMTLRASHNIDARQLSASAFAVSRSIIDLVVSSAQPIITTNAAADPRFSTKDSVALHSLRSIVCVPIAISGAVIGAIYLDNRIEENSFTDADLDFASAFAAQAAVALDNARTFENVKVDRNAMHDVLESLPGGIIAIDANGRITLLNAAAARLLGDGTQALLNGSYRRLSRHLDGALVMLFDEVIHYSLAGGDLIEGRLPDGREVAINASVAPLKNGDGGNVGAVMMLEDRTDSMHHERERNMVRRYLPTELVDAFTGTSSLDFSGARVDVSVMFADLRGFTAFSENRDPAEVVELLNRCFAAATGGITQNRGILDKYMGDAVMAHFNSPLLPQTEHALLAVRAAWQIREAMVCARRGDPDTSGLGFGFGISTGTALAGNVGAPDHVEYTLIGDCVNLARQLQEVAAPDQILISRATLDAVGEGVKVRELTPMPLKGRTEAILVYEVLAVQP